MADALKKADDHAVTRVKQFLVFNQISVVLAMITGFVFYVVWVDTWVLLAGEVYMTALFFAIDWARRNMTVDRLDSVGVGIMLANWCTAVVLTLIAPFSYPLGILQVAAPVIAAGPVLARKGLIRSVLGAMVFSAAVTAIGLGLSDTELNDSIPEDTADVIIILGVAVMTVPVGIGTFDAHDRQTQALRRALRTNALIRDSRTRLVQAADDERRRLERDLHDGAQQQLVAVAMELRLLRSATGMDAEIDPLVDELESALENLRELAHGIYPPLLRSRGLTEALGAAGRRSPLTVAIDVDVERHDAEIEAAIYFCCLEAIQNATKHAGPNATISIEIGETTNLITGSVSDDGPGFAPDPDAVGVGLRNMEDRIGAVGGDLAITNDNGTRVAFTIPVIADET
ncbi:MAG: hypothetical protein DHS20C19_08690 [Acidimicrobiales bacterium]|nr:MAG: hypothetical protein DHS20C19_08690 [Acidimicrobiales bacterium]